MDIFPATLADIPLEIEHLDDTFEKSIARYDIPYRDGALLEDMGQKARVIRFRCYFWDDDQDHLTYHRHILLLNTLRTEDPAPLALVHPRYGTIKGYVEQVSVRHDERQSVAEVDLTFVEQLRREIKASSPLETLRVAAVIPQVEATLAATLAAAGLNCTAEVTPGQSFMEQSAKLLVQGRAGIAKARSFLAQVEQSITSLQGIFTEVAIVAGDGIATISFFTNLPGTLLATVSGTFARLTALHAAAASAPAHFADSMRSAAAGVETSSGQAAPVRAMAAAYTIEAVAGMLAEDQAGRNRSKRAEGEASFTLTGQLQPTELPLLMTVNELESTLATVGTMVNRALELDRSLTGLKAAYAALVGHVATTKLEREKISIVELDNPLPLHLLCFRHGLPYNAAPRVMAINRIPQPNFTAGTVNMYVR